MPHNHWRYPAACHPKIPMYVASAYTAGFYSDSDFMALYRQNFNFFIAQLLYVFIHYCFHLFLRPRMHSVYPNCHFSRFPIAPCIIRYCPESHFLKTASYRTVQHAFPVLRTGPQCLPFHNTDAAQ